MGTRTWVVRYKPAIVLLVHGTWFNLDGTVHLNMHHDYEDLLLVEVDIFTISRTNDM
jgi:hypothetical protein